MPTERPLLPPAHSDPLVGQLLEPSKGPPLSQSWCQQLHRRRSPQPRQRSNRSWIPISQLGKRPLWSRRMLLRKSQKSLRIVHFRLSLLLPLRSTGPSSRLMSPRFWPNRRSRKIQTPATSLISNNSTALSTSPSLPTARSVKSGRKSSKTEPSTDGSVVRISCLYSPRT